MPSARTWGWWCVVGLIALSLSLLGGTPASARVIQDDFNSSSLDPNLWSVDLWGTGLSVQPTNGRLEITFPAAASGDFLMAQVNCEIDLEGDFDAQVDFQLLDWPAANGLNVSLATGVNFMLSRYSYDFWDQEGYLLNHGGIMWSVPALETTGKLRLTRTGTTMEAFFWRDNAWQSLGRYTDLSFGGRTHVALAVDAGQPSRFKGTLVRVAFDNFILRLPGGGPSFLPLLLE